MKIILLVAACLPALAHAQTTSTQNRYDAAASRQKTGSDPDRVICRTAVETGSLVKRTRRCMTARQWTAFMSNENDAARNIVRDNAGLVTGN